MSEDEDIARAIALSLQEPAQASSSKGKVHTVEDDDNDNDSEARFQADLARAIAASRDGASPATSVTTSLSSEDSDRVNEPGPSSRSSITVVPQPASSFLSERAQLEQARLARLKRLRDDSEQQKSEEPLRKRQTPSTASSRASSRTTASEKGKGKAREEADIFWDGELRQTANKHVEPRRNGEDGTPIFRLSEIIGDTSQIELAIISSYALELSWIYTFFARSTPIVLVTQPAPSENGNATVKEVLPNWIRVTPFLRGGRGVMHMKFFLLFYKSGRLRIVVSTANLIDHDWRDIENTVWVQDVPRRPAPGIPHDPKADDFPTTFERVLTALNIGPAINSLVATDHPNIPLPALRGGALRTRWDFSRVRANLIPSIAGKHEGWPAVLKTGHTALMRAANRLNPQQRPVSLECQGSSIGAYSAAWLAEFVLSARGISPEAALDAPKSRRATTPLPTRETLRILFPTRDWVRASVLGEPGGGTMFCRRSTWEAAKFPRQLFCESRSRRGRVLMHSKMIIATFAKGSSPINVDTDTDSDADSDIVEVKKDKEDTMGYAYVGSHNFTPSAWGTLSGSGFTPVLNVTNYELGVVFPLKDEAQLNRVVCYERPPKRYGPKDRPWIQEESEYFKG
ncbi:tyrosyl-DNA phosphodiesterase-domain-containing protein [Gloeopeniophorella convolvens]|nr:tyrosyl-DNA phosphodiesterase-domain-containing protein [Gloeopeniophorella convolvens]